MPLPLPSGRECGYRNRHQSVPVPCRGRRRVPKPNLICPGVGNPRPYATITGPAYVEQTEYGLSYRACVTESPAMVPYAESHAPLIGRCSAQRQCIHRAPHPCRPSATAALFRHVGCGSGREVEGERRWSGGYGGCVPGGCAISRLLRLQRQDSRMSQLVAGLDPGGTMRLSTMLAFLGSLSAGLVGCGSSGAATCPIRTTAVKSRRDVRSVQYLRRRCGLAALDTTHGDCTTSCRPRFPALPVWNPACTRGAPS